MSSTSSSKKLVNVASKRKLKKMTPATPEVGSRNRAGTGKPARKETAVATGLPNDPELQMTVGANQCSKGIKVRTTFSMWQALLTGQRSARNDQEQVANPANLKVSCHSFCGSMIFSQPR